MNTHNERSPRFEGSFFVTPPLSFSAEKVARCSLARLIILPSGDWKVQKSADRADRVDHSAAKSEETADRADHSAAKSEKSADRADRVDHSPSRIKNKENHRLFLSRGGAAVSTLLWVARFPGLRSFHYFHGRVSDRRNPLGPRLYRRACWLERYVSVLV